MANNQASELLKQGEKFNDEKKYEEAIQSFLKAIQQEPKNALAYLRLGDAYKALQRFEEAIKPYEKSI